MKKIISILLMLLLIIAPTSTFAADDFEIEKIITETASYIYETVKTNEPPIKKLAISPTPPVVDIPVIN